MGDRIEGQLTCHHCVYPSSRWKDCDQGSPTTTTDAPLTIDCARLCATVTVINGGKKPYVEPVLILTRLAWDLKLASALH